jgi:hypothetical protein
MHCLSPVQTFLLCIAEAVHPHIVHTYNDVHKSDLLCKINIIVAAHKSLMLGYPVLHMCNQSLIRAMIGIVSVLFSK